MIVQCPNCSARYRVNEQNIPATGGRISCPSCQHAFVVYPESAAPAAPSASAAYDGEKTSVATDINSLMAGLKMNQGQDAGEADDFAATEVIGGDALANFNFNDPSLLSQPADDGTVEMKNPLSFIKSYDAQNAQDTQQASSPSATGQPRPRVTPFRDTVVASDSAMALDDGDLMTEVAPGISFDPPEPTPPTQPPRPQPVMPSPAGAPRFPTGQNPAVKAFQQGQNHAPQAPPQSPAPAPSPFGAAAPPFQQPAPAAPQQPAPSAPPQAAAGPSATHQGPWKLKTDFGLTYEFQDSRSLLSWMLGRESLENYELSAGDEKFFAWREFPQISQGMSQGKSGAAASPMHHATGPLPAVPANAPFPSSPAPAGRGADPFAGGGGANNKSSNPNFDPAFPRTASPSGAFPSAGLPHAGTPSQVGKPIAANQSAYVPPSRDAKWNVVLWILFVVLALGCLALAAQIFGVVNFKEMLGLEKPAPIEAPVSTPVVTPTTPNPVNGEPDGVSPPTQDEPPAVSPEDQKKARTMVEDARRDMEANKLASARQKLETALVLDPDLREVYLLLAEVYERSGLPDQAKEMKDKLQLLQNQEEMEMEMKNDDPIIP